MSASSSTAFRARPIRWSRSAACARCSACPTCCRSGSAAAATSSLDPLKVGPVSVGYRLLKDGIAFGGKQLTTTDIAVAAGVLTLGDRKKVAHLDAATCRKVFAEAARMAEEAIDRMKTEAGDVPLIAVGGGAFLIPEKLPGVSQVVHVEHGDCANAVGAAIAQVSGECDQIFKDLSRARRHCRRPRHRQRPRRGGRRRPQDAQHHRKRGHAAGLPARQLGARAGAGGGRRRGALVSIGLVLMASSASAQGTVGRTSRPISGS